MHTLSHGRNLFESFAQMQDQNSYIHPPDTRRHGDCIYILMKE